MDTYGILGYPISKQTHMTHRGWSFRPRPQILRFPQKAKRRFSWPSSGCTKRCPPVVKCKGWLVLINRMNYWYMMIYVNICLHLSIYIHWSTCIRICLITINPKHLPRHIDQLSLSCWGLHLIESPDGETLDSTQKTELNLDPFDFPVFPDIGSMVHSGTEKKLRYVNVPYVWPCFAGDIPWNLGLNK